MEILITIIIGIAISIISKILNNKYVKSKDSRGFKRHQPEYSQPEVNVVPEGQNTHLNYSYKEASEESEPEFDYIKRDKKETDDLLNDFDPLKAIVYSEIMKPKYLD